MYQYKTHCKLMLRKHNYDQTTDCRRKQKLTVRNYNVGRFPCITSWWLALAPIRARASRYCSLADAWVMDYVCMKFQFATEWEINYTFTTYFIVRRVELIHRLPVTMILENIEVCLLGIRWKTSRSFNFNAYRLRNGNTLLLFRK